METDLTLKQSVNKKFFLLLYKLYSPFLSKTKAQRQFSIYIDDRLSGIVQLYKSETSGRTFIQIALIPSPSLKGKGYMIYKEIFDRLKLDNISWVAHYANYPSWRLLYKLGGGLNYKLKPYYSRLFGWYSRDIDPKMRQALKDYLPKAKKKYSKFRYQIDSRKGLKKLILLYVLRDFVEKYNSIEKVFKYVVERFKYGFLDKNFNIVSNYKQGIVQRPEEFLQTLKGSCFDVALFLFYILSTHFNKQPFILYFDQPNSYQHAVCCYKIKNTFFGIEISNIKHQNIHKADSLDDLVDKIKDYLTLDKSKKLLVRKIDKRIFKAKTISQFMKLAKTFKIIKKFIKDVNYGE